jgi:hypothetical protein
MILGTVIGQVIQPNLGMIAGEILDYPHFTQVGEDFTASVVDDTAVDPVVLAMEVISHDPAQKGALIAAVVGSHLTGDAPPPKDSANAEEEEEEEASE